MELTTFPKQNNKFGTLILNAGILSVLICLLTLRFLFSADTSDWKISNFIYFFIFSFSNFFLILIITFLIIGYGPLKLGFKKTAFCLLGFSGGLLFAWLLTDSFIYEQFRIHLNLAMVEMTLFGQGQVVPLSATTILFSLLLFLLSIGIGFFCTYFSFKLPFKNSYGRIVLGIGAFLYILSNIIYGFSFAKHKTSYVEVSQMLPANSPIRFNKILLKTGLLSREEIYAENIKTTSSNKHFSYPLAPLNCPPLKEKLNIVFIFIDALRYDMLNDATMPSTNEFAKKTIRFNDHWSGGINTRHGIFTLFTGIPGSYWEPALNSKTPSVLIQALQKQKYEIGTFAGAQLSMPEFNQTVFAGVENLRIQPKGNTTLEKDETAIQDFEKWIKNLPASQPFFGFIFLDNVHAYSFPEDEENTPFQPYWKEINHIKLSKNFDATPYFNRYKNAVRFADKKVGEILNFLENQNLLQNTIVIISSDHGEEFNDNGLNYWGHNGNFSKFQNKVPFLIYWPGKAPYEINYRTSMLDVVPTLVPEVLGCTNQISDYSTGKSLWEDAKRPFIYSSNYSKNAFIEPNRTIVVNEKGMLDFFDKNYNKDKNRRIPPYINQVLSETTKFLK